MSLKIISVSELNNYLKEKLENDRLLRNIWVKGELSNFKHHNSGHMYFTVKDRESTLRAVMFKSFNYNLPFEPTNGTSVLARGNISMYLRDGQYQLYVEELQPEGYGVMSLAYEQLKKKLQDEGLFAQERKKTIPVLPGKIGIVSSPTGAALQDILTVLLRRFPSANIVIAPTQVQGEQAPGLIVNALKKISKIKGIDVIIIGRGGGTLEELWAFNTEEVAREISRCEIPVITGIGHETDFTIADFVADIRAATPSAAAELAVPVQEELMQTLNRLKQRLSRIIPAHLNQRSQMLDSLERDLLKAINIKVVACKSRFMLAGEKLNILSPLSNLGRGYSICRDYQSKKIILKANQTYTGQQVEIILPEEDKLICLVQEIKEG